jgi:glucose-1-phosphate cytidylyltransferase
MQTILLAGGLGTRISEETVSRPKPMVEIGGRPILWHIMHSYAAFGFREFVIAGGYRADVIKTYFHNLHLLTSDWVLDFRDRTREAIGGEMPDWRVTIVDTGLHTQTAGRILRLRAWTGGETFMVTYGDGLADVDLEALVAFHRRHGKLATVTAVRPPARFGRLQLDGEQVVAFEEKRQAAEGWVNGGFFVFEPQVFAYLGGDATMLEREPLEALAADGQLMAYQHAGFWQPMDTLREKQQLESLWASGEAPWRPANLAQRTAARQAA